jgi:hypothetical protein
MSEEDTAPTEHDVEALLAQLPRRVAHTLRECPVCLSFLRDGIPLTADAYMRINHPGKTEDELDCNEWDLVRAVRAYERRSFALTDELVRALLRRLPETVRVHFRPNPFCWWFLEDGAHLTVDTYMRHMHWGKTEDELPPKERELLAAIRIYEGLPKLERDIEAMLAHQPWFVAFQLGQSPTCLNFLRNGIPLTVEAYVQLVHPGKTEDELTPEERELLRAIDLYEDHSKREPREGDAYHVYGEEHREELMKHIGDWRHPRQD